jgi:NodT family efflux transporter outer membrane factor (OMF) lipoprotein
MLRGPWWRIFGDSELDALEANLDINNQNIKQYYQNYLEARALIGEQSAQLYPSLTANGSYTHSRTPPGLPGTTIFSALDFSWAIDIWGKVENAMRSAQYNAQLSAADLENERLIEQSSLAVYFFELRGQDALEKLYNDTITADKAALDYTQAQFDTGISDKISVVEATNTLQNAEATATNLGVARAQYEHAISVLIGEDPSSFSIPPQALNTRPPPIPIGVPSELLERRPDIAASERAMAAANAQIGVAYAAYYPTVTLSDQNGFQSDVFRNLFDTHNHLWSIGPDVSETVFDAGLRGATIRQYVATYNADLAAYRQTVLTAFQQVEDYLAQVRILSKQILIQRDAEKSAEEYLNLEMNRYKTGIDPYVDVVTAQTTLLTDQQEVIDVQIQQMTGAVQLVEALGGGWDRSQLPSAHEVSIKPHGADTEIQR